MNPLAPISSLALSESAAMDDKTIATSTLLLSDKQCEGLSATIFSVAMVPVAS